VRLDARDGHGLLKMGSHRPRMLYEQVTGGAGTTPALPGGCKTKFEPLMGFIGHKRYRSTIANETL